MAKKDDVAPVEPDAQPEAPAPAPAAPPEPEARAWIRSTGGALRPITEAIARDFTIHYEGQAYHHVDDTPDGVWIYSQ